LLLSATALWAAESAKAPRITQIREDVYRYLNERVRIEGFVTEYIDANSQTTAFFYFKDDWGGVIRVRTSNAPPTVGRRYAIAGPVGFDPRTQDPYLSEEERVDLSAPAQAKPAPTQPAQAAAPVNAPGPALKGTAMLVVIGVTAVVLAGIAASFAYYLLSGRSSRPRTDDFSRAAANPAEALPQPQQVVDGRTIKIHAPPPNTIKLLPAWLEVLSGDDIVRQVRFYKLRGERSEFTFGRSEGRPYTHIQLKPMTVSSRQAKLEFENGSALLTNFASADSNPTKVDGRELVIDESVPLRGSEQIEMGEIVFRYHSA
jgi:hypothetical protein